MDLLVARLERVLAYIRAGAIFQANLAQRFTARLAAPPIALYARVRAESPAPYGGWMDLGGPRVLRGAEVPVLAVPHPADGARRAALAADAHHANA